MADDTAPDCECGEVEVAADPREPPSVRCACGCGESPQDRRRVRQPNVEIGSDALSGNISRTFNLITLPRPIPLRVSRTVPAVQSAAFKSIDIAECAGVGKVELDDIVTAVEWCAREWPQRRTLTGGRERTGRRRCTDARSGRGGTGRGGRPALRLERSRMELALKAGQTQPQLAERTARRDAMAREEEGSKHLLGRRKYKKRRARRDVLELVHFSPVSIQLRSLFDRRRADRRYSPHHPRTAAAITQCCSSNAKIMSCMRTSRSCDVGACGEWISCAAAR